MEPKKKKRKKKKVKNEAWKITKTPLENWRIPESEPY